MLKKLGLAEKVYRVKLSQLEPPPAKAAEEQIVAEPERELVSV
jgi:hypothetical protein